MNDLSDNLITIVNNPYSLKERNGFDLHDGICIPEKIKFLSSPLTTVVNFIFVPPKIWRQKPKHRDTPINCTDVNEELCTFKHYDKSMKLVPSWTPRPRFDIIT